MNFDPEKYAAECRAMDAETLVAVYGNASEGFGQTKHQLFLFRIAEQRAELLRRLAPAAKVVDRPLLAILLAELCPDCDAADVAEEVADLIESNAVPWREGT